MIECAIGRAAGASNSDSPRASGGDDAARFEVDTVVTEGRTRAAAQSGDHHTACVRGDRGVLNQDSIVRVSRTRASSPVHCDSSVAARINLSAHVDNDTNIALRGSCSTALAGDIDRTPTRCDRRIGSSDEHPVVIVSGRVAARPVDGDDSCPTGSDLAAVDNNDTDVLRRIADTSSLSGDGHVAGVRGDRAVLDPNTIVSSSRA